MEQSDIPDVVYSLAISPNFATDGICFAARSSGLYRSDDWGNMWRFAYGSLGLDTPLTTTIVVLSPNFGVDHCVFVGIHGGVLRSTDGGNSWQIVRLLGPPPLASTLVVSPDFTHDATVLAGTMEDGVFLSTDGGSRCVMTPGI
jgi:photosystem II stability/assembly factor-like uncharacterized protein